jgi:hypothetical protein
MFLKWVLFGSQWRLTRLSQASHSPFPTLLSDTYTTMFSSLIKSLELESLDPYYVLLVAVLFTLTTAIASVINTRFRHLSNFPGPWWAAYTRFWLVKTIASGDSAKRFADISKEYGKLSPFITEEHKQEHAVMASFVPPSLFPIIMALSDRSPRQDRTQPSSYERSRVDPENSGSSIALQAWTLVWFHENWSAHSKHNIGEGQGQAQPSSPSDVCWCKFLLSPRSKTEVLIHWFK